MTPTQFSIHDTKVCFMSSTKYKRTSCCVNIDQLSAHRSLGTMNGNLLFGIIDVFHIEYRVSGGKGSALAQDPAFGIQRQDLSFSGRTFWSILAGKDLGLSDSDGSIASISTHMPSRRHSRLQGVSGCLISIKIGKAGQYTSGRSRHAIVHSTANIIRRVRRGSSVSNSGGSSIHGPESSGGFRLPFIFVLRSCEFQTYSKEGAGVHFSAGGKLPSTSCPGIVFGLLCCHHIVHVL